MLCPIARAACDITSSQLGASRTRKYQPVEAQPTTVHRCHRLSQYQ
ncbi:hypothetical protein ACFPRL_16225 [Pseudoclavibacter helvolus]